MKDACSWLREYGSSSAIESIQVGDIEIRKMGVTDTEFLVTSSVWFYIIYFSDAFAANI